MNCTKAATFCLIAALAASACSTTPRRFSATVIPVPAPESGSAQSETDAFATCDTLVRTGHRGNFAAAAASGAGGALGGFGGAVLSTSITYGSLSAAGATAMAAIPVLGVAGAIGVNRLIRGKRERSYKKHMDSCLAEFGFSVVDWTRMKKKQPATATLRPAAGEGAAGAESIETQPATAPI